MIEISYQGSYTDKHGRLRSRKHYRTPDGKEWHEPRTGQEIADLPPDALVIIGGRGSPRPKSDYDGYYIAGSPFLPAIAHLMPVYIEGEMTAEQQEEERYL